MANPTDPIPPNPFPSDPTLARELRAYLREHVARERKGLALGNAILSLLLDPSPAVQAVLDLSPEPIVAMGPPMLAATLGRQEVMLDECTALLARLEKAAI